MIQEWLIDAYNLLHLLKSSKSQSGVAMDRSVFCGLLAEFASSKKIRVTAVFDGIADDAELAVHETAFFRAVYSKKINADSWIERVLFEKRNEVRFTVVTNDRAIAQMARGGGSCAMGCLEFVMLLKETHLENFDKLLKDKMKSYDFNRPLEDKLRKKGLI